MVDLLQTVLQVYARRQLRQAPQGSGGGAGGDGGTHAVLHEVLAAEVHAWQRLILQRAEEGLIS
jgi:hypothetical protein